jgi:hypothetical protein
VAVCRQTPQVDCNPQVAGRGCILFAIAGGARHGGQPAALTGGGGEDLGAGSWVRTGGNLAALPLPAARAATRPASPCRPGSPPPPRCPPQWLVAAALGEGGAAEDPRWWTGGGTGGQLEGIGPARPRAAASDPRPRREIKTRHRRRAAGRRRELAHKLGSCRPHKQLTSRNWYMLGSSWIWAGPLRNDS